MATPADLQALIDAVNWANNSGQITGPELQTLFDECVTLFSGGGGGGGGGLISVANIAALLALPTTSSPALLTQAYRFGIFVWNSADLSALVAADPSQGIYVTQAPTFIVSGTLTPAFAGTYALAGGFNGKNYYECPGVGVLWWINSGPGYWVITSIANLGNAGVTTDFYFPSSATLPPTGVYTNDSGVTGTATVSAGPGGVAGASGAWVRQYAGPADLGFWGGAGDGKLVYSAGVLSFPTNPTNGQTFTVTPLSGSPTVVTFRTSGATGNDVNIVAGNAAATAAAFLAAMQASTDFALSLVTYTAGSSSTSINVVAKTPGPATSGFFMANYACSTTVTGANVPAALSGGICTGTDNGSAMAGFSAWARYQGTVLGNGVELTCSPGLYLFSLASAAPFLTGMPRFHFKAYGTTWQNIDSFSQSIEPWPAALFPFSNGTNYLIQSTLVRDTQVTCVTPAQAVNMVPGIYYAVMSVDMQYNGSPPNCFQVDYVKCTYANAATGVVKFDRPLRWAHLSTTPDLNNTSPCGAARIWPIDQGFYGVYGTWDIEHIYEGMTVLPNFGSQITPYQSFTGRSIKTINWRGVGASETVAENVTHYTPHFLFKGESDKIVNSISYYDMQIDGGFDLVFQSASPTRLMMKNCKVSGALVSGAKMVDIENCDIDDVSLGSFTNGLLMSGSIRNSRVSKYASTKIGLNEGTVDGTNVTFSNGTFKILASSGLFGIPWKGIVGQQVYLAGPFGFFVGDQSLGYIVSLTTDGSNNLYINTTLPYATLPSWANGDVILLGGYAMRCENSSGCDTIQQASWAAAMGLKEWEVCHYILDGNAGNTGSAVGGYNPDITLIGQGTSITIDVKIPAGSACRIIWDWYNICGAALPFTVPATPLEITINCAIAGKRVFTQSGITGAQSGDSITLGGVTKTALPALFFGNGSNSISLGGVNALPPYQCPLVEFLMQTDTGLFRTLNMETVR